MYLFLFLISVALIYIFWCLKTQRHKKKETREGFLAKGKQASTIQKSGRRKLTQHITRGDDDEEVFDLTYSPLWIEQKQESISALIIDNSNLGASNADLVGELNAIAGEIQAMSQSNSNLNDQITEVNNFIDGLKSYILTTYHDTGTHSNYIGTTTNEYLSLSNVKEGKSNIIQAFQDKADDIENMLTKDKLSDAGTSYATKGEIDSLISKFGRVKQIYIQFKASLESISNIDVTSPSNADIEDLYTQMSNVCTGRTGSCHYLDGQGADARLTLSNYGYSFDRAAWPDSNCIAQNEDCYDDPTTFTCSSNLDTCYYYEGTQLGGTMISSNFPMEVFINEESNYSCITSTSISDPCRTSNQVQAQIDCLSNNYVCYAISNDENSNQWTYSNGLMNQVYDSSSESNGQPGSCTSNQCTYSLDTARAAVSNYCDTNDDDVCYAFNIYDYTLEPIPSSNVVDASGDTIVNFPAGQLAVYESSVDGGQCWRRICDMDSNQHTDRSVLCSSNTDECFYYSATGSTGSGTITSSNQALYLSYDSSNCVSPCAFDTDGAACEAQSNLCWTSSNGELSSSWSTNSLIGSNCSNVCDHNSQAEACSNDQQTCYTYSDNNQGSRSGTISSSEHTFTYDSGDTCDNPCDSSRGLYGSQSNACATKSNICYTLSGTTVNSNYEVNTLDGDNSNCVDSCTGFETGQEACGTLSNLCYSLNSNGQLTSDYRTYTYSNGQCVAPTPCSNEDDFGICSFPASNDPILSWTTISSNDTVCYTNNIGAQKVRTFNQQAIVGQSNDGSCIYDSSASNTYTRIFTSNLGENCNPFLAGTFTASYNPAQSNITVNGDFSGSIYDDDTFITIQIEGIDYSYISDALITPPFVFNDILSDTDNYDGKTLSLRLENVINGVTYISNTISDIEINFDQESECTTQTDTCWSLVGSSLSSNYVSKTWDGSSCVTSCTSPYYPSASAACATLTNTCYSVSNYETVVTSSGTMEPNTGLTQCIPQPPCTYTEAFTISIGSVVARVNASLDLMFDNTLSTPNAQFYIVKTATQSEVKLYEAINGKYLYIYESLCTLSDSSSTFKIFKTGTDKEYNVKNVSGEWWANLFGTNKQGRFSSDSDKTIITTSIAIQDQFLSEYNVDCEFNGAGLLNTGNTDTCLSDSCQQIKNIKLIQKPSGAGKPCSQFISDTYGTGFTYDGSFDVLNIDDEIEITSECDFGDATDRDCCTSNDIFYKFEAYYYTYFPIPNSSNQIILKSDYDGYNDSYTFTVTLPQNYGYDNLDYTFTKAQWENNELPYLDSTNMTTTWTPNKIKLTKTYGHPDTPSCRPSILDTLPSLGDPIFKNISTTIPTPQCDSNNEGHYTTPAQYLYMHGTTVSDSNAYDTCVTSITRHRQWETSVCEPPTNALNNTGQSYDSNGLECFEVDTNLFNSSLLGSGSKKYAFGYSFTIDTITKIKIGGSNSQVVTEIEYTYRWKVHKKSDTFTEIAEWTNNSLYSDSFIFDDGTLSLDSNVGLNTFINAVDNEDSKHNRTYKIEVSVTRTSDGYTNTKSVEFEYFQYVMNVESVVDNVSYNNNTNQLTINLKSGSDYELGHWGEAKTQILLYSSISESPLLGSNFLNTKTSTNAIIFNSLTLTQQNIYLRLYHEETNMYSTINSRVIMYYYEM